MGGFVYTMSNSSSDGTVKIGKYSEDPSQERFEELSSSAPALRKFSFKYYCFVNVLRTIIFVCVVAFTSPVTAQQLKRVELKDGVNAYESRAIASAMAGLITSTLKNYIENSHFVYGPICETGTVECRGNLNFNVSFRAASLDLNLDEIDEVIVYYEAPGFCGSGGCTSYILGQTTDDNSWKVLGQFFPGLEPSISTLKSEGFLNIYYEVKNEIYKCFYRSGSYIC